MLRLVLVAAFAMFARATFAEVTIRVLTSDDASKHRVIVEGHSQEALLELRRQSTEKLSEHFKLFVVGSGLQSTLPAILGDCFLEQEQLVFQPRYGLVAGQSYRATFLSPLPNQSRTETTFTVPTASPVERTKVDAIYPSAPELPQNLLRFYLHFSAPMQQGNVYRYIEITHQNGAKLELPFLELSEELWDRSGKRLTLLLDPGRVKRGLVPREQDGAILEKGKRYRFKIDSRWPDVHGIPLGTDTVKEFEVTDEDFSQPNPREWKVIIPKTAVPSKTSKGSLEVIFPDSLDHALLERCIEVVDSTGKTIPGVVSVTDRERRWGFSPDTSWKHGVYTLRINPVLEDVAGNSIARPFEVDLSQPAAAEPTRLPVLRFEIP